MTVEVHPAGVACNLQCTFCYQHNMRDAGNVSDGRWDFEAVKKALARQSNKSAPTLFGGEALLLPLPQLEEFFVWTKQTYGHAGMQTNASLFTEAHHEMVNRVGVYVGVSLDGPGELNDARWAGTNEDPQRYSEKRGCIRTAGQRRPHLGRHHHALPGQCDEGQAAKNEGVVPIPRRTRPSERAPTYYGER